MINDMLFYVLFSHKKTHIRAPHTLFLSYAVHNQTSVFSRGCLHPSTLKTNTQWYQITLIGHQPYVVKTSWGCFQSDTDLWITAASGLSQSSFCAQCDQEI